MERGVGALKSCTGKCTPPGFVFPKRSDKGAFSEQRKLLRLHWGGGGVGGFAEGELGAS